MRRTRRWLAAAAWTGAGLALYAFFLRVSFGARVNSDGANNALQAWDLVHGHLPLRGWHIGDASRAVRCAVAVTVLSVPLLATQGVLMLLEEPDHIGTSMFILRAVDIRKSVAAPGWTVNVPGWETNALWYDPSRYRATFAVADVHDRYPVTPFEQFFGRPTATCQVASWLVLVYGRNLLGQVQPMLP